MPGDGDGVVKSPVAAVAAWGERLELSDLDDTSPAAAIAAAEEAHRKQRDAEFASKRQALEAEMKAEDDWWGWYANAKVEAEARAKREAEEAKLQAERDEDRRIKERREKQEREAKEAAQRAERLKVERERVEKMERDRKEEVARIEREKAEEQRRAIKARRGSSSKDLVK